MVAITVLVGLSFVIVETLTDRYDRQHPKPIADCNNVCSCRPQGNSTINQGFPELQK